VELLVATDAQKRSRLQEKRLAADIDGRVQKGSGSGPSLSQKGDARSIGEIRAEAKTTRARSYSLKLADWRKVQAQAIQGGLEEPVMQIQFEGQGAHTRLAVIDWYNYVQYREERAGLVSESAKRENKQETWGYDG
jgi:hypothetical protein